jgi:type III secretion protein W
MESAQISAGVAVSSVSGRVDRAEDGPRGIFMGAEVAVADDPMSLLADAAEELTFSLTESEESRLDERKEKSEKKPDYKAYVTAAHEVLQHPDDEAERSLNHLERLFKTRNTMELARLMQEIRSALQGTGRKEPDPADQFIMLVGLKERLGDGHALAGSIDAALETLAAENGSAVASGLAVDSAVPAYADLGKDHDLRGVYRGMTADFSSPREALTRLLDHFGQNGLDKGLDFLMTVLGSELSSLSPSVERSRLKALTGDLAVVRVLGAVRMRCIGILERLDSVHGVKSKAGPEALLDGILTLRDEPYAGIRDMQRITALAGLPDTEREVLFLQDVLQGLRDLPDLFYDGHETRLRVLDAAQSALDDAVRREEEELGF